MRIFCRGFSAAGFSAAFCSFLLFLCEMIVIYAKMAVTGCTDGCTDTPKSRQNRTSLCFARICIIFSWKNVLYFTCNTNVTNMYYLCNKHEGKILCSPEGSHFPSENKEENPLLAREFAFSFGKQGGKSSARQRARIFLRKTRRI